MRWLIAALVCGGALASCRDSSQPGEATAGVAYAAPPIRVPAALPKPPPPAAKPWTFVALSDLHIPHAGANATVDRVIAALVAMKPRAVVITGDFTNGATSGVVKPHWWPAITAALEPLRAAKIPVLPVAGNHDTYGYAQTKAYHDAWGDLTAWTPGLTLKSDPPRRGKDGTPEISVARVPFSYSVDIEGVHFALTHIVTQHLEAPVAAWLKADLAAASAAKARLVIGHVPLSSVIAAPSKAFQTSFGPLLEEGRVDLAIYGHEHIAWDEMIALPKATPLRQVLVGCSSGLYNFGPSPASMARAGCAAATGKAGTYRCKMPITGGAFELVPVNHKDAHHIQHHKATFMQFTVEDGKITPTPMTVDEAGQVKPFYL